MIRFSVIILTFHTLSICCFFLSSKAVGLYMVMTGTSTFAESSVYAFITYKIRQEVMETESATTFVGCPMQNKNNIPAGYGEDSLPFPNSSIPACSKWETSPTTTKRLQAPCLQDVGKKPPLNCSPYRPGCCQPVQGWLLCPVPRYHNPGHTLRLDFLCSSTPHLQAEEGKVKHRPPLLTHPITTPGGGRLW